MKVTVKDKPTYDALIALCEWDNQISSLTLLNVYNRPLPDSFYERIVDAKIDAVTLEWAPEHAGAEIVDVDVSASAVDGTTILVATVLTAAGDEIVVDVITE